MGKKKKKKPNICFILRTLVFAFEITVKWRLLFSGIKTTAKDVTIQCVFFFWILVVLMIYLPILYEIVKPFTVSKQ